MNRNFGFLKVKKVRVFGAEVFVHWTALPCALIPVFPLANGPLEVAICAVLVLLLIFIHEIGHAFVAKKLGYQPTTIILKDIHGYCSYEFLKNSNIEKDEAKIAWGGVLAQLTVAIPLILVATTTSLLNTKTMTPVVVIFGYYSVLMVIINLLPIKTLDGSKAWKLFGIWWAERKTKVTLESPVKLDKKIRRIK
jgi:Zn-dependent protease